MSRSSRPMPDIFSKAKRSAVMSLIRGAGNKDTELRLMQVFRANGFTGWRRGCKIRGQKTEDREQRRRFAVRPDFVFPRKKLAVFVDGCFWHGCPKHATQPATNRAFWKKKFMANKARDLVVGRTLRQAGWRVVRVWEHELAKSSQGKCLRRIRVALRNKSNNCR